MPYSVAVNDQTGERMLLVDGEWKKVDKLATNPQTKERAFLVGGNWLTHQTSAASAAPSAASAPTQKQETTLDRDPKVGMGELATTLVTGAISLPVQAGASLYSAATAPAGRRAEEARDASKSVREAMIYQPRTEIGKQYVEEAGRVLGIPGAIGERAQEQAAGLENKGMPGTAKAAQIIARMAPEAAAVALGAEYGGKGLGAAKTVAARAAQAALKPLDIARDFVTSKGLKWDELPAGVQDKLKLVARDPETLKTIDPEVIKREARAETLKLPMTHGEITRSVEHLAEEEVVSKTKAGKDIREIHSQQDERLHKLVDELRAGTGAKAGTREAVGKSVQDEALRAKAKASQQNYDALYKKARTTEPTAAVTPEPLYDYLNKNPEVQHLGWMQTWLNKAKIKTTAEGPGTQIDVATDLGSALKARGKAPETQVEIRDVNLTELDDLRKKAAGIARKGGTDAYYAGEIVKAIDQAFEKVPPAAKAWRAARDAFKAHKTEFEDQSIVKNLGTNKSRADRHVALEDTVDKVLRSSSEDIGKLRKTLVSGGTEATRAAGVRAWRNLQAGVLDYLREKASGKRQIAGEKGQGQFNAPFRDAFAELDADGKIDALFSPAEAKRLREIHEAVGDVRTKPASRISGSATAANIPVLEKVAQIPYGRHLAASIRAIGAVGRAGEKMKIAGRAKTSPLKRAAQQAAKEARKSKGYTLESLQRAAPAATPFAMKDLDQQQ